MITVLFLGIRIAATLGAVFVVAAVARGDLPAALPAAFSAAAGFGFLRWAGGRS